MGRRIVLTTVCDGEFNLESSCWQRILIDGLNLLFLVIYCLSLIVSSSLKLNLPRRNPRRDIAFLVASICCAAVAIAHLASVAWAAVFAPGEEVSLVHLVRGLVWAFSVVSLNLHPARWIEGLVSVWWVSFGLCITALDLKIVATATGRRRLPILEAASWPANLMLLFCGIRVIITNQSDRTAARSDLSQPLLNEGPDTTGLSSAGFFSKLTFSWLNPLLRRGYSQPVRISEIPNLGSEDGAGLAHQTFIKEWDLRRKDSTNRSNLSLLALARCYKKEMLLVGIYALLKTLSVGAAPLLLYEFVQYSNDRNRDLRKGSALVGCLLFIKVIESLSQRHWFFDSRRFGMRMRSALMAAVFQKLLKLSSPARRRHSTGEIVNYIAVDAYRLGEFPWWFHMAWSSPLQLLLAVTILFSTAGVGAIFAMIPLVICGLLNIPFAKLFQNCQHQFMIAQDKRLRATSEILNSMKIIKLQSWEEHFRKVIGALRDEEFEWLKETQIKKSYGTAIFWMVPTIISAVIFGGCVIMKSAPLNAGTIFTVLATLRVMSEPVRMLPEVLSVMIQVKVSLDRLDVFFLEDEIKEEDVNRNKFQNSEVCVEINNGVFSWDLQSPNLALNDIYLKINRRQKVAICGHVGAGKSSLLYAILGEIPKYTGSIDVFGSIAYVSQTSWIQSGTIQDNILYGKPMNKKRYEMVIKSCALEKDIENFDNGDLTEIGQRGLNMSGGQKQRIQLARAAFSDSDIYLLDDPFSAVDAHTAAILFHDCVMNTLMEKTVILVTHQIEFLAEMDQILVMQNGQITQAGTYEELLTSGAAFQQLVNAHQSSMTGIDSANNQRIKKARKSDEILFGSNEYETVKESKKGDISAKGTSANKLTEEEEKEIGDGGWKPYRNYISVSKGIYHLSAVVFSQLAFVLLQMSSTYWLAIGVQFIHVNNYILVGAYTVISVVSCLFAYLRSWLAAHLGLRASKEFFSGLMNSVFTAPMLFFDSTPMGRILTRASSDLSILDFDIPFAISFVLAPSIELIFIILLMATVTWQVLAAAIPVQIAVIYLQRYYVASARELVRINGTTKAPIMNHTAETTLGVVTIRAFAVVERFIKDNIRLINTDAMLFFHTIGAMEWVLIRVEALQILTIVTATVLLILLPPDSIAPGFVGLSLSYALTLTTTQVFLTRWYSSLDNYIISVERIKQYMHLSSEAPAIINDSRPPPSWPEEGRIDLEDLKIKYRPNAPLVLKGISCTFAAGHKIGIVGRTGSGKTTLISVLFRLVEPAGGKILIDNLDICSIGLKDLRMKLSIIPQDPTLFKGSIRSNLDPLGLYSDSEIWEALEKCQLKTTVSSLPELLDSSVSDEGENWSVGQRQLFCLGRVLLRRNKILVLDEATASIDSATDAALQRIIREEFTDCTVITVAHRVPTVIDSDMVMVLSYGKLLEYDTPTNLMGCDSSFSKLVAEYWSNCKRASSHNLGNV